MSKQQKTTMEWRRIAELDDDPRNSRTHSAEQIDAIKASIREFGPTSPILTHGNVIKAGHARRQAAQELGLDEFPCVDLSHLTDDQARAYLIADNRLTEFGSGWDHEVLLAEREYFDSISDVSFDVTGFSDSDMDSIAEALSSINGQDETIEDPPIPDVPEEPVTQTGDVWQLGEHILVCGDSTKPESYSHLGTKAELLHADPPYGMGKEKDGVANDNLTGERLDDFHVAWFTAARTALTDNASFYIWGNAFELWRLWFTRFAPLSSIIITNEICWDKNNTAGMRSPQATKYPTASERCLFGRFGDQSVKEKRSYFDTTHAATTDVWRFSRVRGEERHGHATPKPVEMMALAIRSSCPKGGTVVEPFGGSGSTLLGAAQINRKSYAVELLPQWCDVIIERWEMTTGQSAKLMHRA